MKVKGLEFAVVRYGYIENDLAWNVALPNPATRSNRDPKPIYEKFPASYVFIKHPDVGNILYDVGEYPPEEDGAPFPEFLADNFPVIMERDDYIDRFLQRNGIAMDDIEAIILSHMHFDHANGLKFFSGTKPGQNIYVGRDDFMQAAATTLAADNEATLRSAYRRSILTIPGLKYTFLDDDEIEIFPGITLFKLGGHTSGVYAMLLELEGGNYLLPSDACGSSTNYGPPAIAPSIIYDSLGFERCIRTLYKIERKYDAKIIFSHDHLLDNTYRYFPDFYR